MKEQVLSISQMQHLKELGVDASNASMKYISRYPSCDYIEECNDFIPVDISFHAKRYNEKGKTFNLQDMLDIMPYGTRIVKDFVCGKDYWICNVIDNDDILVNADGNTPIESVYNMFCWLAENGYLKNK